MSWFNSKRESLTQTIIREEEHENPGEQLAQNKMQQVLGSLGPINIMYDHSQPVLNYFAPSPIKHMRGLTFFQHRSPPRYLSALPEIHNVERVIKSRFL
jgi:hypothetical protein